MQQVYLLCSHVLFIIMGGVLMFNVGEYVVYKRDVCKIKEIKKMVLIIKTTMS